VESPDKSVRVVLPALEPIDWGQPADDEARGRIELRALLEAK
jgi:hypothetical protein